MQLALLSAVATAAAVAAAADVVPPLRTSGRFIVDSTGARAKLSCANWYGLDQRDYALGGLHVRSTAAIAGLINTLGFSCVRLPWSVEMVLSNPLIPAYAVAGEPLLQGGGTRGLDGMDVAVRAAAAAGLLVVLDNHMSDADWCCSTSDENGLWYNDRWPEAAWRSAWVAVALRYRNVSAVVGADLRNELRAATVGGVSRAPTWGDGAAATDWRAAASAMGDALLAVAPHWLILVEGLNYATDLSGVLRFPIILARAHDKLVYSPHDYVFSDTYSSSYASFAASRRASWGFIAEPAGGVNKPLWLGEFGTCNTNTAACVAGPVGKGLWFTQLMRYLNETDVDWAYWAIDGTESTGRGRTFGRAESYGVLAPSWAAPASADLLAALRGIMAPWAPLPSPTRSGTGSPTGSPAGTPAPTASLSPGASASGTAPPTVTPSPGPSPPSHLSAGVTLAMPPAPAGAPGECLNVLEVFVFDTCGRLVSAALAGGVASQSSTYGGNAAAFGIDLQANQATLVPAQRFVNTGCSAAGDAWRVTFAAPAAVWRVLVFNRLDSLAVAGRLVAGGTRVGRLPLAGEPQWLPVTSPASVSAYTFAPLDAAAVGAAPSPSPGGVRFVRVLQPLSACLHFVELLALDHAGCVNVALRKPATASSSAWGGLATAPVDGDVPLDADTGFTHSDCSPGSWWQVDLLAPVSLAAVVVINRAPVTVTATGFSVSSLAGRLAGAQLQLLSASGALVLAVTLTGDVVQTHNVSALLAAAAASVSVTATASVTASATASPSVTATASPTATASVTATASGSPSRSSTVTGSSSGTGSGTLSGTPSGTPTRTRSVSGTPSGTGTGAGTAPATRTRSAAATGSASPSGSATGSATPPATRSGSASGSATSRASRSVTGSASESKTGSPSGAPTRSATGAPSGSRTRSGAATASRSGPPTLSATPTLSGSASATGAESTDTGTGSGAPTATATATAPASGSPTGTGAASATPSATRVPPSGGVRSASPSRTRTRSRSATRSRSRSRSRTRKAKR